ncbi:aminoglycoside phosphotransferase family protein [Sphaerisporangium album]|uniref:Aminoglycoside phosphotransferase family protein n=1 Tax=Sphaerisporangium album TaxID=509200 RepID=A0A367EUX6_9ACTN|nr:aminoglycoside phosphotransferase family protein [Sphaerisporangium album]RCG21918.1 aminoglycoside phosphotransferase family protein [Sphaerisporangium album]
MAGTYEDRGAGVEEALAGDGVTQGIVRVAGTVRRPVRPFTATVQAYLAHLRAAGFADAPQPLGYDDQGREVLSFVPGDVPREPLTEDTAREEVLVELARLVRRLHDAAQGWTPPGDAVWGGTPGRRNTNATSDGEPQVVGHRDYCPGNVVFRGGLPAALIDFDLAKPTSRVDDLANALYYWAPLLDPLDRSPAYADLDVPRRVALFADAYGMTGRQREVLVPAAARMIGRFHVNMRAAAEVDPVFRRFWDEGAKDRLPRAEAWIHEHGPAITARLVA